MEFFLDLFKNFEPLLVVLIILGILLTVTAFLLFGLGCLSKSLDFMQESLLKLRQKWTERKRVQQKEAYATFATNFATIFTKGFCEELMKKIDVSTSRHDKRESLVGKWENEKSYRFEIIDCGGYFTIEFFDCPTWENHLRNKPMVIRETTATGDKSNLYYIDFMEYLSLAYSDRDDTIYITEFIKPFNRVDEFTSKMVNEPDISQSVPSVSEVDECPPVLSNLDMEKAFAPESSELSPGLIERISEIAGDTKPDAAGLSFEELNLYH